MLKCGEVNLRAMELLDAGQHRRLRPSRAHGGSLGAKKGKAILVSGHDLKDLEELLKQTEGKGINVYTHGEMLPAHGYPGLKKYTHLCGHYGDGLAEPGARSSPNFPGAILMTTNCIQSPAEAYKEQHLHHGPRGLAGRGPHRRPATSRR